MPRFFLENIRPDAKTLLLEGENAVHAKVLRLKNGEEVTVCDGCGTDYTCTVAEVSDKTVCLTVQSAGKSSSEAAVRVSVYMGFAKSDKSEHVIQKATELGAYEIVAFPCSRCVSRPDDKSVAKKVERWQKIAASAAEQSRRGVIPQVRTVNSYAEAVRQAAQTDLPVLFYENEHARTFRAAIEERPFVTAALLTGPEGGFEESEVAQAERAGIKICTLGSRILRCETAPLCGLSALMYAAGEF